jgi:hypothetical protein
MKSRQSDGFDNEAVNISRLGPIAKGKTMAVVSKNQV